MKRFSAVFRYAIIAFCLLVLQRYQTQWFFSQFQKYLLLSIKLGKKSIILRQFLRISRITFVLIFETGCLPMSQRNFPASFWNSEYQYPVSSVSGASGAASSLSSLAMGHAALISGHHTAADIYGAAAHDPYANLFGYGAAAGNTTGKSSR